MPKGKARSFPGPESFALQEEESELSGDKGEAHPTDTQKVVAGGWGEGSVGKVFVVRV